MKGTLCVFSYSGFITIENNENFSVLRANVDGFDLILEQPLRIAKPTWRPIPQFDETSLRAVIPSTPPEVSVMRISAHPIFKDGNIGIQIYFGDEQENQVSLPKDTLIIHVYGEGHDEKGEKIAQEIISRMFAWLRVTSQQWWIGKSSEALTGNLHLNLEMTDYSCAHGHPIPRVKQTTASPQTRAVSFTMWHDAFDKAVRRVDPDVGDTLLMDSMYNFHSGNILSMFISVCSSLELMRDDVISRKKLTDSSIKSTKLTAHLSGAFGRLINRNLEKEHPEDFEFVKSCWIARGNVAHGKKLYWKYKGKTSNFNEVDMSWFFEKLKSVQAWLRSL